MTLDLSVFKDADNDKCKLTSNSKHIIRNCVALKRLISSLKYYSMLDVVNNETDQALFTNFIDNVYIQLVDDYNHLDEAHQDQLQRLNQLIIKYKILSPCEIHNCSFSSRHLQNNQTTLKPNLYPSLNVYKDIMDSCHFYLLHQFDCGLMALQLDNAHNAPDLATKNENSNHYDFELEKIQNTIHNTKKNTKNFDRYNTDTNNNKFTIMISDQHETSSNSSYNATFIEELEKYLHEIGADYWDILQLKILTDSEAYDTDAIISDVEFVVNGNIANDVKQTKTLNAIKMFSKNIQLQTASFSIGLTFYYWPYFDGIEEMDSFDEETVNDHGGHAVKDLYVPMKYKDFKKEILNYKNIPFKSYKDVVEKAGLYIKSKMARQLKADLYGNAIHYGINQGEKLLIDNIISVILYCDYSEHCTDFSSSFRKLQPFESLESVKKRNQEYWWMSKILRETVEIYGQNRDGIWDGIHIPKYEAVNRINKLIGPFFTGLSHEMIVPEFNIRLCSPTSTSKKLEVAIKFGGDVGMVIQLNNPPFGEYELGKAFNCSWVSRYKEEDERLFFGGSWRTKIEAIRMLRTKINFGKYFHWLTYFDGMVNGTVMDRDTIRREYKSKARKTMKQLIKSTVESIPVADAKVLCMKKNNEIKLNKYLYQTFECFCRHKQQIVLPLEKLQNYCDEILRNIIMHPMVCYNSKYYLSNNKTNLFRELLFKIFPNLSSIVIYSRPRTYAFSLVALLNLIQLSPILNEVKVQAEQYETTNGLDKSWLWASTTRFIIQEYEKKGYKISLETKTFAQDEFDDELEVVDVLWIKRII
eukprot:42110_1